MDTSNSKNKREDTKENEDSDNEKESNMKTKDDELSMSENDNQDTGTTTDVVEHSKVDSGSTNTNTDTQTRLLNDESLPSEVHKLTETTQTTEMPTAIGEASVSTMSITSRTSTKYIVLEKKVIDLIEETDMEVGKELVDVVDTVISEMESGTSVKVSTVDIFKKILAKKKAQLEIVKQHRDSQPITDASTVFSKLDSLPEDFFSILFEQACKVNNKRKGNL